MAREGKWDLTGAVSFLRKRGVKVVDEMSKDQKLIRTISPFPTSLRILGARDYLINNHRFKLETGS